MSHFAQNYASIDNLDESALLSSGKVNGRVDLVSPMPAFNLAMFQSKKVDNKSYKNEALEGQISQTAVSDLYFSPRNIDALQEGIRNRVYAESGISIARQSDNELKVIMRSIYLQYSVNDGSDCVAQVKKLNAAVLNWAVPEVLSNVLQYQTYRKDASTLPIPFENPQLQTMKGTRQPILFKFE
jgi:hypothetical protein